MGETDEMHQKDDRPVAIIPARGGSKAIPRKNLIDLGGKPLLAWTISAALAAGVRAVVTSDDAEILATAAAHGAETVERPAQLAEDAVHSIHAVLDALDQLEAGGNELNVVLMLLPTSPFRTAADIIAALTLFDEAKPPAVISVEALDKQVLHLRQIDDDGALVPFLPWDQLTAQRQEQPPLYGLNGSIYVANCGVLRANGTFHVPGALASIMSAETSVDINVPADLDYARYLLSRMNQ